MYILTKLTPMAQELKVWKADPEGWAANALSESSK